MRAIAATLIGFSVALLASAQLGAAESNPVRRRPPADAEATIERFIVKLRASQSNLQTQASPSGESLAAANTQRLNALAARAGMTLHGQRAISPTLQMMQVSSVTRGNATADMLARLDADSDVEYVVPDRRVYAHATSNDPLANGQWYLEAGEVSAINANGAWDTTLGSNNVVIAVLDTGVRFDHPDLLRTSQSGRLLPGFDFVSQDSAGVFTTANDGNARDSDPSDPGDACNAGTSSWHGTRVSGIIGALTDNATGVAGITWFGQILPVRVLGKCGGFNSDVLAAMRWAAGLSVSGVPANPNPAKILNLSLGGQGACDSASADVVSEVNALGVLVVVSAGNEGGPVDSPANCPGAAAIAGLRHAGTKVGYSSLGPQVTVSAPAGNCVNLSTTLPCEFSIDTTTNSGADAPGTNTYTDKIDENIGTSFSSPIVAGIAGLMLAVNSNLRSPQLVARLKEGAKKPFPTTSDTGTPPVCHVPTSQNDVQGTECSCTTSTCGAGMANANGAVQAALRPIATITAPGSITPGSNVTLQGGGSTAADGRTIATFSWTAAGGTPISTTATANVTAHASGSTAACLTVTDDAGKQDTAKVTLTSTSATVTTVDPGTTGCPTQVTVAATDANAAEAGLDPGTFTLTRNGDLASPLVVTFSMSGTAVNGTDYQPIGTNVTFAVSAATATVTLTPIDNTVVTAAETATLTIQLGTGYEAGSPSSATITIAENDVAAPPTTSPSTGGGGGGGGGGALDWLTLLVILGATTWVAVGRHPRRRGAFLVTLRAAVLPARRGRRE